SERGSPCLEKSGAIVLPGLAERRRSRRYPTDLAGLLTINGATHEVRIADISTKGYGVTGCDGFGLDLGQSGLLELDGQSARAVEVRWVHGDRAGLQRI
ncbi:MAG: PilZ domain-containing protein, partial [Pseudomonadota bacterium]